MSDKCPIDESCVHYPSNGACFHKVNCMLETLKSVKAENKKLKEALRKTTKCDTENCDGIIDTDYCSKCKRQWES